jgi:hypothetical protein
MTKPDDLKGTKALMGALICQPPKRHDEMKVGKKSQEGGKEKAVKARPSLVVRGRFYQV